MRTSVPSPNVLPLCALLAPGLCALLAAACSPPSESLGPTPGRSNRPRGGPTASPSSSADAPARFELWAQIKDFRVALGRAASQHVAGEHEAETLANEAASAYPNLGPARSLGAGAILVQRLYAPGSTTPEGHFVMVRRSRPDAGLEWEFVVLDADGFVIDQSVEACARCHAEAPHDGLFGRAR